jgi:hypothetical protein
MRKTTRQIVTKGRVSCPETKRDVDIDGCGECPNLVDIETDSGKTIMTCSPSTPPEDQEPPCD